MLQSNFIFVFFNKPIDTKIPNGLFPAVFQTCNQQLTIHLHAPFKIL